MHQRFTNNSANPASGPECSVPATGWAGTRWMPAGTWGAMSRSTADLTEPTSDRIAPRARCGPISFAAAPLWPTGMQTITRSALSTAAALVSTTWSASPSSSARRRVAAERAVATMLRTTPCARAARAIEEPIRPTPISARRLNRTRFAIVSVSSAPLTSGLCHERGERLDGQPVRLLAPDAHAQRMRQPVGADLTQDQATRGEKGVGILCGATFLLRKVDEHEIGDARRHLETELADLFSEPRQPVSVVLARDLEMRRILDRRDPGHDGRSIDVEGSADPVHGVDHMRRSVEPAQAQGCEAVDLRERTAHDDIVRGRNEFNPGLVIIARHIFGIRRVEHEQHMRRQARVQPL